MKKILSALTLSISIILLLFSSFLKINIPKFNEKEYLSYTNYLSSDFFKGRLCGSFENEFAANYLNDEFSKKEIYSYLEKYNSPCPIKQDDIPYLRVTDNNNNIICDFKYSKDFKEDMASFNVNTINFKKQDIEVSNERFIETFNGNNKVLLFSPENDILNFRSSFSSNNPYSLIYLVTKDTLTKINDYYNQGYTINCYTPMKIENKDLYNVIAKIQGKDEDYPPLILSAHFDHVGSDFSNNVYNGALDNASGASFVLALADYIKDLGTPKGDIYLVLFNGEECGFTGSSYFVENNFDKIKDGREINFDMIGSSNAPLCIMTGEKDSPSLPFVTTIADYCTDEKIYFNYLYKDSSDHVPFRKAGIDAITFCDNDISKIHSLDDDAAYIDVAAANRCFSIISKEIISYSYGNLPLYTYFNIILVCCILGITISLTILIIEKRKEQRA
ncbi:MAG: M28 family metallopeptidase [Clostridiaceae bacterium]